MARPEASRAGRTVALALVLTSIAACGSDEFAPPDPSRIVRADVERVIGILAADDMRGRRAFTEDALRAAEYLAGEFQAAGLETFTGEDGFLQRFDVHSLTPAQAVVTVNGELVPEDQVAMRMGSASLDWGVGDAEVIEIGPGPGAQAQLIDAVRGGTDAILLVRSPDTYQRFAGFFRGPVRVLGESGGSSLVMALTDAPVESLIEVTARATVVDEPLANVVGMIPGHRANEYVLFSGHYDHIGIRPPVDGDSIANGANDDASGTTAVVALGKYFAERGTPERTLLFAAFTAEEGGGYGSRYFSGQLDPDDIVAMFNLEMIGKPAVEGPNTAWITGFERSSFGPLLQAAVEGTEYSFYPDPYPDQNLFYRSDNATLARLGVPAHSISTTPLDVDGDYHQVTDHVETLDLDHMTSTIRAIAMGAETIISGEATPTRVDPATVN